MKAVYGGKVESKTKEVEIPNLIPSGNPLSIQIDPYTGMPQSIKRGDEEVLKTPMRLNILRYVDNDRYLLPSFKEVYRLPDCKPQIFSCEKRETGYRVVGVLAANCLMPALEFTIEYILSGCELLMDVSYKIADYIKNFPRFGIEFGVDLKYGEFAYIGFGKTESYIDKNAACEYGYFESTAKENYDRRYVMPQESGSHYASKYLQLKGLFQMTAEKNFSFSVNPYTTKQLFETAHAFELKENEFVDVCVDLAMRGVGSYSCGPALDEKYEMPKVGRNIFKFVF